VYHPFLNLLCGVLGRRTVVNHYDRWFLAGRNVMTMLRSEQKIVNSRKAIVFDNRTQN